MQSNRLFAALCLMLPAQAAHAASVQSEFKEVWQSRLQRYEGDFEAARKRVEVATRELVAAVQGNDPKAKDSLQTLYGATNDAGYASGRALVIRSILDLMLKKPSSSRATLWTEDELSAITSLKVEVDAAFKVVENKSASGPSGDAKAELDNRMRAVFLAGQLRGRTVELQSVNENLEIFFEAKSEQDREKREKWAKILGSLRNSESNRDTGSSIITCNTIGITTTCM